METIDIDSNSSIYNYWKWTKYVAIKTVAKLAELVSLSFLALYYMAEAVVWTVTPSFLLPEKSIRGKVVLVTGGAGGLGQELVLRLARQDAKVVVWDTNEKGSYALAYPSVPAGFLLPEKSIRGKVVLVTGGAGGLGQELVLRLGRQDAKVVVWDTNEKAITELIEKTKEEGHLIHTYSVDVTDKEVVYKYAKMVKEDVGPVDILINNAGIVCGQTFLDIPDYMIEKTFKVNILAHYWTVKAFLPDMIKKRDGHIVTVGSLTGLLGTYKCSDYSASKFATVGFHESLSTELKAHGHHNINMTLICPYFINTGMFDGCKPKNLPMLEPRDVAKRIITAIKREEAFVTLPAFARFVIPLKNYLPSKLGWALMIRVIKGPQSMMGLRSFKEIEAA